VFKLDTLVKGGRGLSSLTALDLEDYSSLVALPKEVGTCPL